MDHGTENGTTQISFHTCGTDSLAGPNSIHDGTSSKWFERIIHVIRIRFIHPHTLCCHKGLQHLSRKLRDGLPRDDTRQGGGLTNLRYSSVELDHTSCCCDDVALDLPLRRWN